MKGSNLCFLVKVNDTERMYLLTEREDRWVILELRKEEASLPFLFLI